MLLHTAWKQENDGTSIAEHEFSLLSPRRHCEVSGLTRTCAIYPRKGQGFPSGDLVT